MPLERALPDDGDGTSDVTEARPHASATRRLLYRWFVEYNPLYLVSALLVLGGLTMISRGHAEQGTMSPEVGVIPVIAEVYAAVLIAGAALLTRLGQRRPAVMLALITALYQCDLTLFTERSVYLGSAGGLAVFAWLLVFVAKLYALAWAMRVRVSPSAVAVAAFGALGLAVLPRCLSQADPGHMNALVALWVFSVFAAGLWTSRAVTSSVELDAWGRTVLARVLKATWLMWATLALFHVIFWCAAYQVSPLVLLPVALLLATRWMLRDAAVWCAVTGTLLLVGWVMPGSMSSAALMSASVLCLRAMRRPTWTHHERGERRSTAPYRVPRTGEPPGHRPASLGFTRAKRDAMQRLLIGSLCCVYLSAWTSGWSGGSLPEHVLALDGLLTAAAALIVWRARAWVALAPLAAMYFHLAVQRQHIRAPASPEQWGGAAVGLGFSLLVASLVMSWRLRKVATSAGDGAPSDRGRAAG
ncbi:MAG: hypothetical protein ACMG6S_26695 [Byssovorax sp.]